MFEVTPSQTFSKRSMQISQVSALKIAKRKKKDDDGYNLLIFELSASASSSSRASAILIRFHAFRMDFRHRISHNFWPGIVLRPEKAGEICRGGEEEEGRRREEFAKPVLT